VVARSDVDRRSGRLPIYQFTNSGSGPLPWNAVSLESKIDRTTMIVAPHGASDATEGAFGLPHE